MNTRMKYEFPTNLIQKGKRIVLYGAGNVGQEYNRWIEQTNYVDLVAWVDQNYKDITKGADNREIIVQNPDTVTTIEYDLILIAVIDHRAASTISNNLITKGVDVRKIVWTGKEVYEF